MKVLSEAKQLVPLVRFKYITMYNERKLYPNLFRDMMGESDLTEASSLSVTIHMHLLEGSAAS